MTSVTTLRLDRLKLHNFRCFAECEVDLHPQLTVFVAENGGGKTAILDALRIALTPLVDFTSNTKQDVRFSKTDIRCVSDSNSLNPVYPAKIITNGYTNKINTTWSKSITGSHGRSSNKTKDLIIAASHFREAHETPLSHSQNQIDLPLVAFFGVTRMVGDKLKIKRDIPRRMIGERRMDGYSACLSDFPYSEDHSDWYQSMMIASKEAMYKHALDFRPEVFLAAVRASTRTILGPTGWSALDWNFQLKKFIVERPDGSFMPLRLLSDGLKTMIALVLDITRRCIKLNPHFSEDAAQKTSGVLLIDEIDMHLHPIWQQQVLQLLQKIFPLMQFIVTTHSPQVITTVPQESIVIIKQNEFYAAPSGTDGAEAQRVLEDVFLVDPRPNTPMSQALKEYLDLVDEKQWDIPRALELRKQLDEWSRGNEPSLVEADLRIANMKWEMGDEEI